MRRVSDTTPCPVCQGPPLPQGELIPWHKIWDHLELEHKVKIAPEVRRRYSVGEHTRLAACENCGLRFFSPAIAGEPDFYQLLGAGRTGYYDKLSWEGRVVRDLIRDSDDVVDLGSGDGTMLRSLPRARTGRSVGVDNNPDAIRAMSAVGLETSSSDFSDLAKAERGNFDVVCAMQVLEHVPDARPLMEACRTLVRDGGRIFVAVPNDERERSRFEPLDYPPHHVSRWIAADFPRLADRFGLEVVAVLNEPDARWAVRRTIMRRIPGRVGWFAGHAISRSMGESLAETIMARWAPSTPRVGHSMLVQMRPRI